MNVAYEDGEFGNRFRVYTLEQVRAGEVEYPVGLRYSGPKPHKRPPDYAKPLRNAEEVEQLIALWRTSPYIEPDLIVISESSMGSDKPPGVSR